MTVMFSKETTSQNTPERSWFRSLQNRWWIGAIIVCLVVVGALHLLCKGRSKSRTRCPAGACDCAGCAGRGCPREEGRFRRLSVRTRRGHAAQYRHREEPRRRRADESPFPGRPGRKQRRTPGRDRLAALRGAADARPRAPWPAIRHCSKMPQLDLVRFQDLVKKDLIPRQQLDTQDSLVHQFEGAVKADQGQIDNARLQLVYSRIIAPISGRIGSAPGGPGQHCACERRGRTCGHHPGAADLGDLFPP